MPLNISRRWGTIQERASRGLGKPLYTTFSGISTIRRVGAFNKHKSLGCKKYQDVYYDLEGSLFANGVYIRKRNWKWEAKLRIGGDFIISAFEETDDSRSMVDIVRKKLNMTGECHNIEDLLSPCADFVTERDSWMIVDKFQVDVNSTNFGHRVGEVELMRYFRDTEDVSDSDQKTLEEPFRAEMDEEITAFMQSHPQAFPFGKPIGKLTAYFKWMKKS